MTCANPVIRTVVKSPAKTNYRGLTEINFCYYGLSLVRTLTLGPYSVRDKGNYGQFALSMGEENPYIFTNFNPLNTDTPLIRTLSMAPSVTVLTGFDCTNEAGCCRLTSIGRRSIAVLKTMRKTTYRARS